MLYLPRYGTGWPLPSPSRPGPKADGQKRSPSSAALCTLCRLGSSWNGKSHPCLAFLCSLARSLFPGHPGLPGPHQQCGPTCSPEQIPLPRPSYLGFSLFSLRMFRRTYTSVGPTHSTAVLKCLKVILGFLGMRRRLRGGNSHWNFQTVYRVIFAFPFNCCFHVLQNKFCPLQRQTPAFLSLSYLERSGKKEAHSTASLFTCFLRLCIIGKSSLKSNCNPCCC